MGEDGGPVVLEMLAELDAARAAEQQYPQLFLAPLEREWSQIDAVEFQQVEGMEKCSAVMLSAVQELEFATPIGSHATALQLGRTWAPMMPQAVHTMRGPNDGTATPSS